LLPGTQEFRQGVESGVPSHARILDGFINEAQARD
jgi:hypothetical protein